MSVSNSLHKVPIAKGPVASGDFWDAPSWREIPSIHLAHHMGEAPAHRPVARVKLQYDAEHLFVLFSVEDRFIRSVVSEYQGDVWTDSCVEFFFTPGVDLDDGYFNIEANCGGTLLFTHRLDRDTGVVPVDESVARRLEVFHTLPSRVDPEITDPVTWQLAYRIPWRMLEAYTPVTRPAPGVRWRGNLYKCADASSHPHWLTWAPVEWPQPDFHRKQFFGTLEFTE
jgi:hypothetical protein